MTSPPRVAAAALAVLLVSAGCRVDQKMARQPSHEPLEPSGLFEDGRSARPLPEGAVARGHLRDDEVFASGRDGGDYAAAVPLPLTRALLQRGRERYDIFCAPCHDRVGTGKGMVVLRGYPQPPSFHVDRLREARPGYLFDVVTRGFGRMPDYSSQIPPEDRWSIAAYLKALQISQRATIGDVPPEERRTLEEEGVK